MARRLPPGELLRRGAIGTLLAAGVVALATPVLETVLEVSPSFKPLAPERAVFLTVVGGALAVGAYALVERRATEPRRTFLLVAALALVLSFVPDLLLLNAGETVVPGVTTAAVAALMILHVLAAGVIVYALVGRAG